MFGGLVPLPNNVEVGFLYEVGSKGVKRTCFSADALVPLYETPQSIVFSQGYYGYSGFPRNGSEDSSFADYRVDAFLGGGYRAFIDNALGIGINGFWDHATILDDGYNSWGIGLEVTYASPGNGLLDLSVNQYGNLFGLLPINIWRNGDLNFDAEVGFTINLLDGAGDLRLKLNGYQFDSGDGGKIGGWRAGVELGIGNGALKVGYDIGSDRFKGTHSTLLANLMLGFDAGAILAGQSPFSLPEPTFVNQQINPRKLLTRKVRRNTNIQRPDTPHFEFQINGPYGWGSGTYAQDSNTHGVWTVTFENNAGRMWTRATSYTVTLVGDTSTLSFPLLVTVTGIPGRPECDGIRTRFRWGGGIGPLFPETTTISSSADVVKTIPPDGNSTGNFSGSTPFVGAREFLPGSPGLQGWITVTAPGVQPLTIDIVSTN